jgi:hypothetical protein
MEWNAILQPASFLSSLLEAAAILGWLGFFVFVFQRVVIRFEQFVGSAIDSANSSSPDYSMDLSLFFATSERTRYGQLLGFLVLGRGSIFFLTGKGHWQECTVPCNTGFTPTLFDELVRQGS